MSVISVCHVKGGVGKTTAAANLAYIAAARGMGTLLVDMDAQAAATFLFRLESGIGAKAKKIAAARKSLRNEIFASDYPGLDLLPASLSFRKLPVLLADEGKNRLGETLTRIGKGYKLIVVDAPAGLSLESEEIIRSSDLVLVPVVPSALGAHTYRAFRTFAASKSKRTTIRAYFSMVDSRRAVHRSTIAALADDPQVLDISVPYASAVERMASERVPLPLVKRPGKSVHAFEALFDRCMSELGLVAPS